MRFRAVLACTRMDADQARRRLAELERSRETAARRLRAAQAG
jgi:hypothetical protein